MTTKRFTPAVFALLVLVIAASVAFFTSRVQSTPVVTAASADTFAISNAHGIVRPVSIDGINPREDGCHTYHLFAHQGGINEIDVEFCGDAAATVVAPVVKVQDEDENEITDTYIPTTDDGDDDTTTIDDGGLIPDGCQVDCGSDDGGTDGGTDVLPTCAKGNPGNLKCVGGSGEDPNNKGTMVLDDPAKLNGQHGNQGQGGNGPTIVHDNNGNGQLKDKDNNGQNKK